MNGKAFFNLKENFEKIHSELNSIPYSSNVAIEFGRGNHLTLVEESWDNLKWFIKKIASAHIFNHVNIEISTSLIGNFNYQVDKAKSLVDIVRNEYDIDVKFVVVANTTIDSIPYWNKIKSFLKIMEEYRNTDEFGNPIEDTTDNCGDILLLNLFPKQIPDIHFLYRQINGIKSPINLSWWLNDVSASTISEENMLDFEDFMKSFVSYVDFDSIDTSFHEFTRMCSDKGYTNLDNNEMIANMYNNSAIYFDSHAEKKKVFFSPVGIIDHERVVCNTRDKKPKSPEAYLKKMVCDMVKRDSCGDCSHFKRCMYTGMMNIGYFNSLSSNAPKYLCPLGLKSALNHMFQD